MQALFDSLKSREKNPTSVLKDILDKLSTDTDVKLPEEYDYLYSLPQTILKLGIFILKNTTVPNKFYLNGQIYKFEDTYKDLVNLLPAEGWCSRDIELLFEFIFSDKQIARLLPVAIENHGRGIYQWHWHKRSFKRPNHPVTILSLQIYFIVKFTESYWQNNTDLGDQKQYVQAYLLAPEHEPHYALQLPYAILSVAIDANVPNIKQTIEDIIYDKHPTAKVTIELINQLVLCDDDHIWMLLKKLLLSAGNQEGLRQMIMERLDYAKPHRMFEMLEFIVEHDLVRYSATMRAIDTWMGLGYTANDGKIFKQILNWIVDFRSAKYTIDELFSNSSQLNYLKLYTALWVIATEDCEKCIPIVENIIESGIVEHQCLAVYFLNQLELADLTTPLYLKILNSIDIDKYLKGERHTTSLVNLIHFDKDYLKTIWQEDVIQQIQAITERFSPYLKQLKDKKIKETAFFFDWLSLNTNSVDLLTHLFDLNMKNQDVMKDLLLHFNTFAVDKRFYLTYEIIGSYNRYSENQKKEPKYRPINDFQRYFCLIAIEDKSSQNMIYVLNALGSIEIDYDELKRVFNNFKRKDPALRNHLFEFMKKQPVSMIKKLIEEQKNAKHDLQKEALLALLVEFKDDPMISDIKTDIVAHFKNVLPPSESVNNLIQQVQNDVKTDIQSIDDIGIYDLSAIPKVTLPAFVSRSGYSHAELENVMFGGYFSPIETLNSAIEKLHDIYIGCVDYEYELIDYEGKKHIELLGNRCDYKQLKAGHLDEYRIFEEFPLHDKWLDWFNGSDITIPDLYLLAIREPRFFGDEKANSLYRVIDKNGFVSKYHAGKIKHIHSKPKAPLSNILYALCYKLIQKNQDKTNRDIIFNLLIDLHHYLHAEIIPNHVPKIKTLIKETAPTNFSNVSYFWYSNTCNILSGYLNFAHALSPLARLDKEQIKTLYCSKQSFYSFLKQVNLDVSKQNIEMYLYAYHHKIIDKNEMMYGLVQEELFRLQTSGADHRKMNHWKKEILKDVLDTAWIEEIKDKILSVELKRGELGTPVTWYAQRINSIYGIDKLILILLGLDRLNFSRGFFYSNSNSVNKQDLFSHFLRNSYPYKDETYEQFQHAIKQINISEKRLIEMSMYAPQWSNWVCDYLGWEGLHSGIWWFHAHTKTSSYGAHNAMLESELAKYSQLDVEDYKQGMIDLDWFYDVYPRLGEKRWKILYEAAKFISDSNGHRRARLNTDVLTHQYSVDEIKAKIIDKRDQEYMRVYGIVKLDDATPKVDVLNRYNFIQAFLKESKQFGAQKRESESIAASVALSNLARNAGFSDATRLTIAMESNQIEILLSQNSFNHEGTTLSISIDIDGDPILIIDKAGKPLKAVPANMKKLPEVVGLNEVYKQLKLQATRARVILESLMTGESELQYEELVSLACHPIVGPRLKKLVIATQSGELGFFDGNNLRDTSGEIIKVKNKAKISYRIAHCIDLHKSKTWSAFQSYCFTHQIQQPFKQVFRELYLLTADEMGDTTDAMRYAGHQVSPKQTIALLKQRGWKLDYENGFQKVNHKRKYYVNIYALADWFSPSDIEEPTLEMVRFYDLKTHTPIALSKIPSIEFSEVMRDLDLVVSVAHVGAVDPEATQSTIGLRAALLIETMNLFKLVNYEIKGTFVIIQGTLAQYSVHLGSGNVHKLGGASIAILPVHSSHRGKVFLPFMDEDPKSAEILTKVLLLAQDNKLKDPTIIEQIARA